MNKSEKQRTIIIGDVHGCLDELNALITKVNYHREKDSLYFLGDIINRGPYSKETFLKVLDLGGVSILGNHEWHILESIRRQQQSVNLLQLKRLFGNHFSGFVDEISNWPAYIETKDFTLVHAGLVPGKHPSETAVETLTHIRTWDGSGNDLKNSENRPWFESYLGAKLVVFGHWASLEGVVRDNVIGLDTGCVYGKKLSALLLPDREIVTVKAARVYHPI